MAGVHLRGGQGAVRRALAALLHAHLVESPGPGDVVIDLAGPIPERRARWIADLEAGRHVLSTSLDPRDAQWAANLWHDRAVRDGLVLLPNAAMGAVLGDVLGALAADAVGAATDVHTAHLIAERGGVRAVAGAAWRAEIAALLGTPSLARDHDRLIEEPWGERRRLAWFARPVGPHHAASIPCPEVVTIARHVPASTITGHLAMSSWQAEALQAWAGLNRHASIERWSQARLARNRNGMSDARWALVSEARGSQGVARAWTNGRNPAAVTAAILDILARRVLEVSGTLGGALAPAQLIEPKELLDAASAQVDLRWSIVRPEQSAGQ
ncbi:MAG: hypothetical protein ACI867_002421 [Glaciecola sp.]|jgi:hypothetical protein